MKQPICTTRGVNANAPERFARIEACLGDQGAQLAQKRVAVVGVGALGGPILGHMAMLGIGELVLIDDGVVELPNLGNQGFDANQVGQLKVEARKAQIHRIHPGCRVQQYPVRLETLGWGVLADVDLVLCGLDNLAGRILLNEICSYLHLPWIDGATDGSGRFMFGRVASYGVGPGAPCFICSFDQRQLVEAQAAERRGCRSWWDDPAPSPPTLSASPECAVIAGLQCVEAIKRLTRTIDPATSTELLVDLDHMRLQPVALQRNPNCLNPHSPFGALVPLDPAESIGTTLASIKNGTDTEPYIRLYKKTFISQVHCLECGRNVPVGVLDTSFRTGHVRCACGHLLTPNPHGLHDTITRENAAGFLERSWKELGLADKDIVSGYAGNTGMHFIAGPEPKLEECHHG